MMQHLDLADVELPTLSTGSRAVTEGVIHRDPVFSDSEADLERFALDHIGEETLLQ
jgi:hypothetical protein